MTDRLQHGSGYTRAMVSGRHPQTTAQRAAIVLLLASALLVVGPLWHDFLHTPALSRDAHAVDPLSNQLAGEASESTTGHLDCEGWEVTSADHGQHGDDRFESAARARHHHHALCQGHVSLTGAARATVAGVLDLPAQVAFGELASSPRGYQAAHPPSRGPPTCLV